MEAKDCLEKFIAAVKQPNALQEDVKKFLTKTQQHNTRYVGQHSVEGSINGFHSLIKDCTALEVIEKYGTNRLVKDFKINLIHPLQGKTKLKVRLVKEIDVRKASLEGEWGINTSSIAIIK